MQARRIALEVFSGDPPCPGCAAITALTQKVAAKYEGVLESSILKGSEAMEKLEQYKLFCVLAVVVNGTIRIAGMCPSKATLNNAPALVVGDPVKFVGLAPSKESLVGALREAGLT